MAGAVCALRPFRHRGVVSNDRAAGPHSHQLGPRIAQDRFHDPEIYHPTRSLDLIHSVDFGPRTVRDQIRLKPQSFATSSPPTWSFGSPEAWMEDRINTERRRSAHFGKGAGFCLEYPHRKESIGCLAIPRPKPEFHGTKRSFSP